jgi:glycosyltransferase involved in cell wall biosynthesis
MKIGLDAKRAFLNPTGLGNYSRNIILGLLEHFPQHQYFLFTPKIVENDFYKKVKSLPNVTIVQPKTKIFTSYWRSFKITGLIKKWGLDVYHGLSNELPYNIKRSAARKVVTIHDLIPFKEDAFRSPIEDFFYKTKMHSACKHADTIVAISQATKKDIQFYFGTPDKKIQVIYQPVIHKELKAPVDVVEKYHLPEKFILQVGTVEYRKNIQVILRAMMQLREPDLHFVIVGKKKRFAKSLQSYGANHGLEDVLHFIDPVTDDELSAFYQSCRAVVYPSLYEGFGLPIVEAIGCGKAVLTTRGSCFEEAGGPGAYYCNTSDANEVALTLHKMLTANNAEMIEAGKQHISRFNRWDAAHALMKIYGG